MKSSTVTIARGLTPAKQLFHPDVFPMVNQFLSLPENINLRNTCTLLFTDELYYSHTPEQFKQYISHERFKNLPDNIKEIDENIKQCREHAYKFASADHFKKRKKYIPIAVLITNSAMCCAAYLTGYGEDSNTLIGNITVLGLSLFLNGFLIQQNWENNEPLSLINQKIKSLELMKSAINYNNTSQKVCNMMKGNCP